jgi:hypothetical protein
MTQRLPAIFGRFNRERLHSGQRKNASPSLHVVQNGDHGSLDRQAQFSHLLARIKVYGVPYYEQEIDQIRTVDHLNESEREIVLEIFRFGYEAAEKERRQDKMAAYQRLLRRLLLHQPLDQPIPLNERSEEITPEVTVHVAEASVTQQSPKQEDTEPQVRTASVPERVLRYALCSIGAAALIWTAFSFRSPRDGRDSVVPVRDNQQDIARAPAAKEDRLEPAAHAGALTPLAAIEPVAERASISMAEPALMRNAIVDEVATSSKIPAAVKPDTPAQPGKTKSPAKVAKRPTTVDAVTGKDREREPARDSLPIYQTRRSILLREEPRFGAPAQIMLDRGARLIVLEINGPWLKVKMENTGAPGFVREEFVAPVTTVPASVTSVNKG